MLDDSSRSDDSNLDKPIASNVANEDSDSQTSSNKRYMNKWESNDQLSHNIQ